MAILHVCPVIVLWYILDNIALFVIYNNKTLCSLAPKIIVFFFAKSKNVEQETT